MTTKCLGYIKNVNWFKVMPVLAVAEQCPAHSATIFYSLPWRQYYSWSCYFLLLHFLTLRTLMLTCRSYLLSCTYPPKIPAFPAARIDLFKSIAQCTRLHCSIARPFLSPHLPSSCILEHLDQYPAPSVNHTHCTQIRPTSWGLLANAIRNGAN